MTRALLAICILAAFALTSLSFQQQSSPNNPPDAIDAAQRQKPTAPNRPEEKKTDHDQSPVFNAPNAEPASPVFRSQPKEGRVSGFDFYRDSLNADHPFMKFDDI